MTREPRRGAALEVRDLRFTYPALWGPLAWLARGPSRPLPVLEGVSFSLAPGEHVCLLGRNGAGKTTLFKAIQGFLDPSGGEIRLEGRPAGREEHRRSGFAAADERSFYHRLTVLENLEFFGGLWGLSAREARERARETSESLGLAPLLHRPFSDLSTGWRQRAALARALLHRPGLLLLDEPTRSLDAPAAARFRALLREEPLRGVTVLFSTHNLEEAREVGSRCLVLAGGRVVLDGPPPSTEGLAALLEASP